MRRALTSIAVALGLAGVSVGLGGTAASASVGPVAGGGGGGGGLAAGGEKVCAITDCRLRELSGLVATATGYVVINDGSVTLPTTSTGNPLDAVGRLAVTGAARSPDGAKVVLRTYADAFEWDVIDGDIVKSITTGTPRVTPLADPFGEAISFTPDGASFVTVSDAGSLGDTAEVAVLRYAPAPSAVPSPSTPAAGSSGGSSLASSLTLEDITYLIGVVGLIGAILVGAGVWGILRARRRPAPTGSGRSGRGDEDGLVGRQPMADPMNADRGGYDDSAWRQRPDGYNEAYPGDRGIETSGGNRRPAGGAVYGARPAGGAVYGGGSAPPGDGPEAGGGVYGGGSSGGVYGGGPGSSGGYRGGAGRDDDERGGHEHRDAYRGDDPRGRQQRHDDPAGWARRPAGGRGGTYGPGGAYGPPTAPEGYGDNHGYGDDGGYGRR